MEPFRAAAPLARALLGWSLVLGLLLAACGSGGDGAGGAVGDATAGAAAEVDGEVAFVANCSVCHGREGEGTQQGPPLVDVIYEPGHHPDESFRQAIAQGVAPHHWDYGPMPALPHLREAEVDAIIAHVRDLQREAGIID